MSAQQSWTSWILGSVGATSSAPTDGTTLPAETANKTSATSSSPSPYGPYIRTGRGGAGNFTWQSERQAQTTSSPHSNDVEATSALPSNPAQSLDEEARDLAQQEHLETTEAVLHSKPPTSNAEPTSSQTPLNPKYMPTGRGGAGNWAPDTDIQAAAQVANTTTAPKGSKAAYTGRGGAGNFALVQSATQKDDAERELQQVQAAEERRGKIEEEVGCKVLPPPGAFLGGEGRKKVGKEDEAERGEWV